MPDHSPSDADAPVPAGDAFAASVDLLRAVASGEYAEDRVVRVYTPAPTLALTRWESMRPGFAAARDYAERTGFDTEIRPTGGRAAAYDPSCLVFDLVVREEGGIDPRPLFVDTSNALAGALRGLGVDARVGAVPGEYCPGEFSINARGEIKLIGTSQRAVRGARLLSGVLPLGDTAVLVDVLAHANAALGLYWSPATFGSLAGEAGPVPRARVAAAIRDALLG